MAGRHGIPLRGLNTTATSPLFQGRFGRMFRNLPAATYGQNPKEQNDNLTLLAGKMVSPQDPADPKDGVDGEESGIPSLFTYFGQFIDHDITFDPSSSLQKQSDPDALVDFRTPAFDLDNVYGRGPDDQPYMYDGDDKFVLGNKINGGDPAATDLARGPNGRALIGDPRNDENSIVSQFQGLLERAHNRFMDEKPKAATFADVQQTLRFHYQYVVLNDFLPKIINAGVLDALKTRGRYDRHKLEFFHWHKDPFMPVEFSGAAYRLGHSMIRPGYRLNKDVIQPIFPIFPPKPGGDGLTGFRPMNPAWGMDWGRFVDVDVRSGARQPNPPDAEVTNRLQFAYRIDTSIVDPLGHLPPNVGPGIESLALRNLKRSITLGLPNGQDVARAMGIDPLDDDDIIIGKAVDTPGDGDVLGPIVKVAGEIFADNCPLWTYILAEAAHHQTKMDIPITGGAKVTTPQLGPVGGRIVAEVFLGLMFGDTNSMLNVNPLWTPGTRKNPRPDFRLKDLVNFALGK